MTKKPLTLCAFSLVLACAMANVQAGVYKWTDDSGAVHYTQTPPPDSSKAKNMDQEISLATGKPQHSSAVKGTDTANATEDKDKPTDEMAAAKQEGAKNEDKHRQFCDQQKTALKQLVSNPVIRWKTAENEEKILTAQERTDKIAEFEKNVKDLCNPQVMPDKTNKTQ